MRVAELNLAGVDSEFNYVVPKRMRAVVAAKDALLNSQLVIVEELL